jgi:hypothetical protein
MKEKAQLITTSLPLASLRVSNMGDACFGASVEVTAALGRSGAAAA